MGCTWMLLAMGCDYNTFSPITPPQEVTPLPNMEISSLRERCVNGPVSLTGEGVILSGYVTSSDRSNNFYQTLLLEDNSGAMEIRAGGYDLYNRYPIGRQLIIRADSLTAAISNGMLQIGLKGNTPTYPVEAMESPIILNRHLFPTDISVIPAPLTTNIPGLRESRIGILIRINQLRLNPPVDTTWAVPATLSATHTPGNVALKFRSGSDSIYVYTSGYASFAGEKVPRDEVSITGILQRGKVEGKEVYQLKMRDLNDVQF